jgi:hypothetical protein
LFTCSESEGNFWQRRTKKEKGLIIAGVGAFLAIIILVIVLTTVKSNKGKSSFCLFELRLMTDLHFNN